MGLLPSELPPFEVRDQVPAGRRFAVAGMPAVDAAATGVAIAVVTGVVTVAAAAEATAVAASDDTDGRARLKS